MSEESATEGRDFLVGNTLIAVELREYRVSMNFSDWRVHVGSNFLLQERDNVCCTIHPEEGTGNIAALWQACGERVVECDWGDIPRFVFENGLSLRIPETGHPRGELSSKHHPIIEDF